MNAHLTADAKVGAQVLALVASDVEHRIARVRWAVEVRLEVKAPDKQTRAAAPTRPAHAVKL
eukprot:918589-Pleurochrysis_carterae.AAC.2